MYKIEFSARAKRSLYKYSRSGSFPQKKFKEALLCLGKGTALPLSYQDHGLHGLLADYREFHIAQDLLVQYERDEILKLITIAKIGTHTELFGG